MREVLIEGRGLTKRFDGFCAVNAIDFQVGRGEAFGFLGPNGAGKTSTMRMIGCTSPVSSGRLQVLGYDATTEGPQIRARLGVVSQEDSLDTELTVRDNLLVYGRYFDLPRAVIRERTEQLLQFVQLAERGDDLVDSLSGGMKRRLAIARALVSEPELLLLDEPTTGLDPQARHLVWDRLHQLKRRGVTFVLTTHYMDEAERLCDRLVIMDQGDIVAEGSPKELIDKHATREVIELRFGTDEERDQALPVAGEVAARAEAVGDRVIVYTDDGEAAADRLTRNGLHAEATIIRRATLEDVFLILTGRSLEEA